MTSFTGLQSKALLPGFLPWLKSDRLYQKRAFSFDLSDGKVCTYTSCSCKKKEIIDLFEGHPNELKAYALKNCPQLTLVKNGLAFYFSEDSCAINQVAKEILFIKRSHEKVFSVSMYTFLEEKDKLTLAGEGGKVTGRHSYWNDLAVHLSNNKDKSFFIYSFGGGQGFDAAAIQSFLTSEQFKVDGFKIIEINELAYHLSDYKSQFVLEDGYTFLTDLPKRNKDQINIFHLGNFLSVLRVDAAIEFLTLLASKMMEGDIISILVIRKDQFKNISALEKNEQSEKNGLAEFDQISKAGKRFFRATVSDIEQFNEFVHGLGLTMMFERIDEEIDAGPKKLKMLFVKLGGYKAIKQNMPI
ncbi:MAG: hypothetical protein KDK71_07815 [Chlamydiia bacterium]|nr:hypothetical protein [Chlamydiia bacterium]